jgi:chromosome partitioning protein
MAAAAPQRRCAAAPHKLVATVIAVSEGERMNPYARTVLTFANKKGGVAKTTLAVQFAFALAARGLRGLLLDMDSQGNASKTVLETVDPDAPNIADVLAGHNQLAEVILPTVAENLFVAPATRTLTDAMIAIIPKIGRESLLRAALETVKDDYQFIIIDTGPEAGLAAVNALCAATDIIIPFTSDRFALEGIGDIKQLLEQLVRVKYTEATILGCIHSALDPRQSTDRKWREDVVADWGEEIYEAVFRVNVNFRLCSARNESIVDVERRIGRAPYRGAKDIESLVDETGVRLVRKRKAPRATKSMKRKGSAGAAA